MVIVGIGIDIVEIVCINCDSGQCDCLVKWVFMDIELVCYVMYNQFEWYLVK